MNAIEVFQDWLNDYLNFEQLPQKDIFWLDTIDYLCKRFDNPQDFAPCVHIAGSKGKGSVSKMISCILNEAGYKVGLYSSPHIVDFRERITSPNGFFDEEIYESAIKEMVPNIESILSLPADRAITWFELVTLYAFLVFKKANVDWSIFEVGLGGRLDATNIIRPKLCCITPIELEHTEFLGDTLEKIAAEKAGIIKNCTPVIIAQQQKESIKLVFREKAFTRHAPFFCVDELIKNPSYSFDQINNKMNVHFESEIFNRPIETKMSLLGKTQVQNATMAAIAVRKLLPNLDESIIEKGLSKATLPGRFEIIKNPDKFPDIDYLILDGAHTINSINSTIDTMNKMFGEKKINLLFGCAKDKNINEIAKLFKYRFNKIFLTRPGDKKQSDLDSEIQAFKNAELSFESDWDYIKSIEKSLNETAKSSSILLITGSFYLVSEMKIYLQK